MTSHGGVFQIWIWPADCTGSFWESGCWRHKCDARSGLLSKSLWEAAGACRIHPGWGVPAGECVQAGWGDCSLPLAGHHAKETLKCHSACPVLPPAHKGVNLSAFPWKPCRLSFWKCPLEQEELWWHLALAKLEVTPGPAHEWRQCWPTAQAALKLHGLFYKQLSALPDLLASFCRGWMSMCCSSWSVICSWRWGKVKCPCQFCWICQQPSDPQAMRGSLWFAESGTDGQYLPAGAFLLSKDTPQCNLG